MKELKTISIKEIENGASSKRFIYWLIKISKDNEHFGVWDVLCNKLL